MNQMCPPKLECFQRQDGASQTKLVLQNYLNKVPPSRLLPIVNEYVRPLLMSAFPNLEIGDSPFSAGPEGVFYIGRDLQLSLTSGHMVSQKEEALSIFQSKPLSQKNIL